MKVGCSVLSSESDESRARVKERAEGKLIWPEGREQEEAWRDVCGDMAIL